MYKRAIGALFPKKIQKKTGLFPTGRQAGGRITISGDFAYCSPFSVIFLLLLRRLSKGNGSNKQLNNNKLNPIAMSKKTIRLFLLPLLLAVAPVAEAQELTDYTLAYDTTQFNTLVGTPGAHPLAAVAGDNNHDFITLPFDFPFGEDLLASGSRVGASANGYLYFGTVHPGDYGQSVWGNPGLTYRIILPFVAADGYCTAAAGQGCFWADTTDEEGVRMLAFEFRHIAPYTGRSDAANDVNYQVRLYEDGTIAVIYDSSAYAHTAVCNLMIANGYADKICLTGAWTQPVAATPATIPSLGTAPVTGARYTFRRPEGFCARPILLTVSDVISSSLTLTWQGEAAAYRVYYASTDNGWDDSVDVSAPTATLDGLSASTAYRLAVASICDGSLSTLCTTEARTACEAVSQLPYTESFEGFDIGAAGWNPCWTRLFRENNQTLNTANPIGTSDAYDGNRAIRLYAHPGYGQWTLFALPEFTTPLSQLQLSFYYKVNRPSNNLLQVGIMANPSDTATFQPLDTLAADGTDWQLAEVDFADWDGSALHIAVKFSTTATTGYETYYCYIDELMVGLPPACQRPVAVRAENITPTSADIVVSDTAAVTSYLITCTSSDTTFSLTAYNDTIATLTDLVPQTAYHIKVLKQCPDGSLTRAVSTDFRTPCNALSHDDLPYADDFNSYSSWSGGFNNPCWNTLNFNVSGYGTYPNISSYTRRGNTGNSLYFCAYHPGQGQYTTLPAIDYVGDLALTFHSYATTDHCVLEVGLMSDPYDTATFIPVSRITPTQSRQWEEQTVTFSNHNDPDLHIAFRNTQDGGMTVTAHQYHIDDLVLDLAPTCSHPLSVRVDSATATTLDLVINDPEYIATYRVVYNADTLVAYDTLVHLADLTPGTAYTISVATLCFNGEVTSEVSTTAHTLCRPLSTTELPWSENFETWPTGNYAEFPTCWNRHFGYAGNWTIYVESKVKAIPDSGRTGIYIQSAYGMQNGILVLPDVDHDLRLLQLSLSLRFNSFGQSTDGIVEIGIVDTADNPSSFRPFDTIANSLSGNQYTLHHIPLLPCGSAIGRIALRYNNQDENDYDYIIIDSLALAIALDSLPPLPQPVELHSQAAICNGLTYTFHDTLLTTAGTYTHSWGDTTETLTLTILPTYADTLVQQATGSFFWQDSTFTESTLYTLTLLTTAGCDSTLTLSLTVNPDPVDPDPVDPDPVGIEESHTIEVSLHPNPATTTVTLGGLEGNSRITLVDISGRTLAELSTQKPEITIDVASLAKGTCFVRIETHGRSATVHKLIVR